MDIEWAKDGNTNELFIVQARPETVHSAKDQKSGGETFQLKEKPPSPVVKGQAVGEKIGIGKVTIVRGASELSKINVGDVLVAPHTNPDWEPVMKRVAAIVTDSGGRTAHAAIVSRELGIPCVVGCGDATTNLNDGETVTVSCAEGTGGKVYRREIAFEIERIDFTNLPETRTKIMFNVADPDKVFALSFLPNDGVGLARLEFIINNRIGIHPMALAKLSEMKNGREKYAVEKILAQTGETDPKEFSFAGSPKPSVKSPPLFIRNPSLSARAILKQMNMRVFWAARNSSLRKKIRCSVFAAHRATTMNAIEKDLRSNARR